MKLPNQVNDTCVYLHTRTDGVVFYVGIGSPTRPYEDTRRNKHWQNTTSKYGYLTTILHENLTWEQACAIEIELIKKYREISGDKLCNITAGGDGAKGTTYNTGKKQSPETVAKRVAHLIGKERSAETRAKIGAANKGKVPSEEVRAKLIESLKGKPLSEEHRTKISASSKGKIHSPEAIAKMSAARKGVAISEEHKEKLRVIAKNRPPMSTETRAKIGVASRGNTYTLGRKLSDEHKAKIGASLKGHKNTLGTHLSDAHKEKLSVAVKSYWATKKEMHETT